MTTVMELGIETSDYPEGVAEELRHLYRPLARMRQRVHGLNGHSLKHELAAARASVVEGEALLDEALQDPDATPTSMAALRRNTDIEGRRRAVADLERLVITLPPILAKDERRFSDRLRKESENAFPLRCIEPMDKIVASLVDQPLREWAHVLEGQLSEVQAIAARAGRLINFAGWSVEGHFTHKNLWMNAVPLLLRPKDMTADFLVIFVLGSLRHRPVVLGK